MKRMKPITEVVTCLLFFSCAPIEKSKDESSAVTSLLSVSTLKKWIDVGYKDGDGRKVIILDTGYDPSLTTRPDYDAGHIPGAHFVEVTQFYTARSEGHIMVQGMVPSGEVMDEFIQKHGIDGQTIVVLTGNHIWGPARAYFALRYWGFPMKNLFLLHGRKKLWETQGLDLEQETPALPARSSFSVRDWTEPIDKSTIKVSTVQMMETIEKGTSNAMIVDARTILEWNGGQIPPGNSVFGFQIKGSVWKEWSTLLDGGEEGPHLFKSATELKKDYQALGVTADKIVYAFCQAAGRAAVHFVALELILKWPVQLHDGSSFELGQLGYVKNDKGEVLGLPEDSPWRFDQEKYCSVIKYNDVDKIVPVDIVDAYAKEANEVLKTDEEYSRSVP